MRRFRPEDPMTAPPSNHRATAMTATATAATAPVDQVAKTGLGIALMVLAVGLFTTMDALVKSLGGTYPTIEIVFFRGIFALVPLAMFILPKGSLAALRTTRPLAHALRAVVGLLSLSAFFYAYIYLPLADVIAISFAAPLFVTALSVPLLGERVGARRWAAVLVGFAGVLVMARPAGGVLHPAALVALGGTVGYALVMIFVRKMSRTETSTAIVFYYSITSALIAGAILPFQWVAPTMPDLMALIAVGLVGGGAQIAMTNAFRLADVSIVAPFDYTGMIWAAILGYAVWGDVPGPNIWIGVAIVTASGLYILRREANLGLRRGVARRLQARR